MKLTINRAAFLQSFAACAACIAKRDIKPILRGVKAAATADACTLTATDLEVSIRVNAQAVQVSEPGECMLSAELFLPILRGCEDEELTVEASQDGIRVNGDASEFELPWEDPAAFPDVPHGEKADALEIDAEALATAVQRTSIAVGENDDGKLRWGASCGIVFDVTDDDLHIVGTNGYSMGTVKVQAIRHGTPAAGVYSVPQKALTVLGKVASQGAVRVSLTPNEAFFSCDGATVYTRLIEGRFPLWRKSIPKLTERFTTTAGLLLNAIRLGSLAADGEVRRVTLAFAKGKLTVEAQDADKGRSKVERAISYDGSPVKLAFQQAFLTNCLRILDTDQEIEFSMKDGKNPAIVTVGDDYRYLAVPLVLTSEGK